MQPGRASGDAQAQPGACRAAGPVATQERLTESLQQVGMHTRAMVGDADKHAAAVATDAELKGRR